MKVKKNSHKNYRFSALINFHPHLPRALYLFPTETINCSTQGHGVIGYNGSGIDRPEPNTIISKLLKPFLSNLLFQLTNNVVSDANNSYTKPALGITWARMPNTRILLCDENQENLSQKLMKVTKSVKKVINK